MAFACARNCICYSKTLISKSSLFFNPLPKSLLFSRQTNLTSTVRSLFYLNRCIKPISTTLPKNNLNEVNLPCFIHTKGDEELAAFLAEEIANEKKSQASPALPTIEGFEAKFNGGNVELLKKIEGEKIVISANVSDSVDAEETLDPDDTKEPKESEMKAKPDFRVNITKHKKTLSFLCSYATDGTGEEGEAYNDVFEINELSVFEGEYDDEVTYSVSGDIMDGYLYDLLMNFLEERGVTNEFADKLIVLFTAYEHQLYINLLQEVKSFVKKAT